MKPTTVKVTLFVLFVMALVITPFFLFDETLVQKWLESHAQQTGLLIVLAIIFLAADSVAPVPATFVIWFLAAKAGVFAGVLAGTIGLCLSVLAAAWVGRFAVGRIAPKFIPDAELARLREALQRRLVLTLACLRSVPVLAETSVIVAAAMGIPVKKIFWATVVPNFVVALIYSLVGGETFAVACIVFLATIVVSYLAWRIFEAKVVAANSSR